MSGMYVAWSAAVELCVVQTAASGVHCLSLSINLPAPAIKMRFFNLIIKVLVILSRPSICVSALMWVYVRLMCHAFHQVSLAVEGSTMSGSLQRRKKSKRKWKRLWFLLKDKVLYTFTAREVRGHRVSHTSPETITHPHDHSIAEAFPHNLCLSFFSSSRQNCLTLTFPLFNLSSWAEHFTNEGILCALSECCTALFFSKPEILVVSHIAADSKIGVILTCALDVFTLVPPG